MVRLFNVSKRYGSKEALRSVSFEIEPGAFAFLTGPSGAGKSTLIKLLLLEEAITNGEILVNNINLKRLPRKRMAEYRRKIGVVFQDFKLLANRTVFQNVALRLEIEGAKASYIGKKVRYILKRVGLEGREQAFPPELSGGEQQRVAIARAIVGDPLLLLADEPTGNLDFDLTMSIMDLLSEINQAGTTVLLATHSQDILNRFDYPVLRLDGGQLLDQG